MVLFLLVLDFLVREEQVQEQLAREPEGHLEVTILKQLEYSVVKKDFLSEFGLYH